DFPHFSAPIVGGECRRRAGTGATYPAVTRVARKSPAGLGGAAPRTLLATQFPDQAYQPRQDRFAPTRPERGNTFVGLSTARTRRWRWGPSSIVRKAAGG